MPVTLKARLAAGDRLVTFSVSRLFHPNVVHLLGMSGAFDGFWVDSEHAGLGVREIESAVSAGLAHGLEAFVRIAPTDYATVTRCFESGAVGVMAAQIHSADHAEEFVQWAKFAPRGRRGLNPLGFDGRWGMTPLAEFAERSNRDTMVAVQIETAGAVEEVDSIAAIAGIDMLFIGPSDLGQAMGVIGDIMHPRCLDAIDRVAAACQTHSKRWGAVTPTAQYANLLIEKGCTLITPTNDVKLMTAGLGAVQETFADLW